MNKIIVCSLMVIVAFLADTARATIDVSLQMQLGNPSGATADPNNHSHYLIQRTVEALDYNDSLREPNWASWDLTAGDVGSSGRSSTFFTDTSLPAGFYQVSGSSGYAGSGYDRGHMCPSADRTDTTADNDMVFLMSNMIPQSPDNNQGLWNNLEADCRTLAAAGNELLITCGPSGFGTNRTASTAQVYIPSNVWKIIVVVPPGSGPALSRITTATRVIAVNTPNIAGVRSTPWTNYLTSVNQLQADTGFTFFSALPANVAAVLRAKIDGSPMPGITNVLPYAGGVGTTVLIKGTNFTGASSVWFNGTNASFTVNSGSQITAIVPANATTGPLSVIDPGGVATSAGNFAVTQTPKPGFQAIRLAAGQISLTITGAVATSYTITASTNLANPQWVTLLTTNPAALPFTFVDTTGLTQRFYRVQNP